MDTNYYKKYEPIFGSWYIDRLIGEGSFGKVFEIRREDFGVSYKAALKTITIPTNQSEMRSAMADGMDEASVREYFGSFVRDLVREFALMSKLKGNSNIVSYENHQVIEHKDGIGWDILIQMELLTPLNDYTRKHTITRKDVIKIGIDMCKALELCQKFNIIHRDVKPENMFISESGNFKLGDFGIARTVEKTSSGLSKKGTYSYMAPEVYKGEAYGSTVDIYSLGIVLYRLLNENRTPFLPAYPAPITHSDRENALAKRFSGAPLPLPVHGEGRLGEIVLKACAYDPSKRYSSPMQMRQELEAILYNREEGRYIYPDGDEVPQQSVQYVKTGEKPPVSPLDATQKDEGKPFRDRTVREFGTTSEPNTGYATVSDFGSTVSNFGRLPNDGGSGGKKVPSVNKAAPRKKRPAKRRRIGVGALLAVIAGLIVIGVMFVFSSGGTKKLRIVVPKYGMPVAYSSDNGYVLGYYKEVAQAIAEEMGYDAEFELMQPIDAFAAVENGEADLVISIQHQLGENLLKSKYFQKSEFSFLTLSDSPVAEELPYDNLDSSQAQNYNIGCLKNSMENTLSSFGHCAQYWGVLYDSISDAVIGLSDKEVDTLVLDTKTAEEIAAQYPEFVAISTEEATSLCCYVSKGNEKLADRLNSAITTMLENGTIESIAEKYRASWTFFEQSYYQNYCFHKVMDSALSPGADDGVVRIGVMASTETGRPAFAYLAQQYSTIEVNGEVCPVELVFSDIYLSFDGYQAEDEKDAQYGIQSAQLFIDAGCDIVCEISGSVSESPGLEPSRNLSAALKEANIPLISCYGEYVTGAFGLAPKNTDRNYPAHFAVNKLGARRILSTEKYGNVFQTRAEELGAVCSELYGNTVEEYKQAIQAFSYIDLIFAASGSGLGVDFRQALLELELQNIPILTDSVWVYQDLLECGFTNVYCVVNEAYWENLNSIDTFGPGFRSWLETTGKAEAYDTGDGFYLVKDHDYQNCDLFLTALQVVEMGGDLFQNLETEIFEGITGSFYFSPSMNATYVSRPIANPGEGFISYTMPH